MTQPTMHTPQGSQDLDAPLGLADGLSPRRRRGAPAWLQLAVIFGLLGSALYVGIEGRYLLCAMLAIGGVTFGMSFILRRMIGDAYDRF